MAQNNEIEIYTDYRDELIGSIAALHSRVYSDLVGFGAHFEAMVATNYANFINRLDYGSNRTWYAEDDGRIIAGLSIDGQTKGENRGYLRWFIVDPDYQSFGLGGKMMQAAMDFCDEQCFEEVHLDTFAGLDAARKLYERFGFELVEEELGRNYGEEVLEQKFVRYK